MEWFICKMFNINDYHITFSVPCCISKYQIIYCLYHISCISYMHLVRLFIRNLAHGFLKTHSFKWYRLRKHITWFAMSSPLSPVIFFLKAVSNNDCGTCLMRPGKPYKKHPFSSFPLLSSYKSCSFSLSWRACLERPQNSIIAWHVQLW